MPAGSLARALAPLALIAALFGCDEAPLPPEMAALYEKAEAQGSVRVIARVAQAGATRPMSNMRAEALSMMRSRGVQYATPLSERLPLVVAEVTRAQLEMLYASGRFDAMMEDAIARPTLAQSVPLVQAPEVWALGARGAGQAVAVLDTGVDAAHPFLAGRVVEEACFSSTSAATGAQASCPNGQSSQTGAGAARPCNAAGCEHGTHVAGIAAGRSETFSGVAPDADIIAVQVFSRFVDRGRTAPCRDSGQASPCIASFTSDQIRALDHVRTLAAARAIASVNMSLGGGRETTACDTDLTKPVIDQLREAGVATVIASGNNGFADAVSRPGCISTAVTVGATDKRDALAEFSNRGPQVDLLAPGVAINSSVPVGNFEAFSGTSMATPHVAGAFATLRSLAPRATVDDIERALSATGVAVGDRPRIAMLGAARALQAQATREPSVTPAAAQDGQGVTGSDALAGLPPDRPVRMIVRVRAGSDRTAAIAAAARAARSAGASRVEPIAGQPLIVVEATPRQYEAIVRSGTIESMQLDATARPQ
jgi:subtilisin family serine protease